MLWQPEPSASCLRNLPPLTGASVRVPKLTQSFRDVAFGKGCMNATQTITVSTTHSRRTLWMAAFFTPSAALAESAQESLTDVPLGADGLASRTSRSRNVVIVWKAPVTKTVEQDVLSCLRN